MGAELDAHFEGTVELLVVRGWTEEDARREARRRFGDLERYRTRLERMARRRRARKRLGAAGETLRAALRDAVRSLRRAPGFSAAVIATFTLGIGANAAIFRAVDRLLLSPPDHVERPAEVRRLFQTWDLGQDGHHTAGIFSYADVRALRASGLPVRVAAFAQGMPETLGEGEGALRVRAARADSVLLPLLGVRPVVGRSFGADDHRPGAPPVALLGHALWESRFGSDPTILGTHLRLGAGTYEVVGVLPRGFVGVMPPAVDVWLPLEAVAHEVWDEGWEESPYTLAFSVVARLGGGTDEEGVVDAATAVLRRSRTEYGVTGELVGISAASLIPGDAPDRRFGTIVSVSRWLAGVSLLVLLVACTNVANLFLAQGERVRRETAVRRALGAGTSRLRLELLTRALLLALIGAGAALVVAAWGGGVLEGLFLEGMELEARPGTGRTLFFTAFLAVSAAILSGLLPALRAPRDDLRGGLASGGRSATGSGGLRRTLVGVQTAMSALLLVGAALFVLSLRSALTMDLGFDHDRLIMVRIEGEADEGPTPPELYRRAEEALRPLSGVASVSRTVAIPFVLLYGLPARLPDGDPGAAPAGGLPLQVNAVGEGFFSTMGIPVLRGRAIEAADLVQGAEPVAVVGRTAAAHVWGGEDPLGRCLVVGREEGVCARVVGVAGEHARQSLGEGMWMAAWVPFTHPAARGPAGLMVRAQGTVGAVAEAVRRRVLEIPSVRYAEVVPMADVVSGQMRTWRLGATVFSLFGLIALGVAAVGLHGVLVYDVSRQRREIGIRMALGAARGRVVRRVLAGALTTVGAGLAVGLGLSAWGAGRLAPLLLGVPPRDVRVFAAAAAVLLLTAALSAALPAWRASRVDPRECLAEE